ncbi:ROK family protein [Cohnella hashimotonis]|uniref:ROK family protein n=1 Tax=Cohnella hashimotonis TaxID=2826895 RepID=A0ABT6TEM6_9BACL|nr:ROK family protein [Cohnella hashimotonis]MDI4645140.1 ROK family protein [Cohnella hashimotonis]
MDEYILAFDVGGTYIKSAALTSSGRIHEQTVAVYPAQSGLAKRELLDYLASLAIAQAGRLCGQAVLRGIGYAFPGPFDYERGISYIRGLEKYESLYGVNLRQEITSRLLASADPTLTMSPAFRIAFANDASLFALGEWMRGKARGYARAVCITIGTGIGSAFLDQGRLVVDSANVPPDGWIYRLPYRDRTVDAYISERGILRLAESRGFVKDGLQVKWLAAMAHEEDQDAIIVFQQFGRYLGEVLNQYVSPYQPDAVVLGGQIAKSSELFMSALLDELQNKDMDVVSTEDTSTSTYVGAARLLEMY